MTIVTNASIMITSFKHKGLKRLFEKGDRSRINANQIEKIELILADLDVAEIISHLHQPSYRLHALKGNFIEHYSINVSGNWRIVFRFEAGKVFDINLVDYH